MRHALNLMISLLLGAASAEGARAELTGYAVLPADTFADGPPSGQYDGNGTKAARPRYPGQPVQGFSAVQFAPGGGYLVMPDNGFGSKANSADALLRLYHITPNPKTTRGGDASVKVGAFISLRDPDRKIPFAILNENTPERLLTGHDFDIESFVVARDGTLWIGEEFGPYLLHFDATGKLLDAPYATPNHADHGTLGGKAPLVIAHRGASGSRPEHTLEAYQLAIDQGADFIEPDLVATKDGILIARHENVIASVDANGNVIEATTDVADHPEFHDRLTSKTVDGKTVRGWFTEDFTLAELKTLKARERLAQLRSTAHDNQYHVPTLAEVIDLVKRAEAQTGRKIGLYPETKHPTYFAREGKRLDGQPINTDLGQKLIDTLVEKQFTDPNRVFIQSFEVNNLKALKSTIMPAAKLDLPLVQLLNWGGAPYDLKASGDQRTYADLASPAGLKDIAAYAKGAGPNKRHLIEPTGSTFNTTNFVRDAHAAGLQVHPWTLRNEPRFLPAGYQGDAEAEVRHLIQQGVDGFFTDFPGTGVNVRQLYTLPEVRSPQHPAVLAASPNPGASSTANLPGSGGYEGLAINPTKTTLYALLEKTVAGDAPGTLRINAFDPNDKTFRGLAGRYRLEHPSHAIGDMTVINDDEYLVIERDGGSGDSAKFKRIYQVNLKRHDARGYVEKTEVADLLDIADPHGLAPSTQGGTFRFPFVTIEDVLVLDANTILVANDNNYPGTGGRGKDVKDNNELLWLKLPVALNLAPGVGQQR